MNKKKVSKSERTSPLVIFKWLFLLIKFLIITLPLFIFRFVGRIIAKLKKEIKEEKIEEKRKSMKAKYSKFALLENISGDYSDWERHWMISESTIGIILGARGSGKSALALKMFENLYDKKKIKLYAMGFKEEEMPSWVEVIDSIDKIRNNSHVLIDEGGILFSSRKSMSSANKLLSELILISRHKNLSVLFISQNSSNLEVNILRQADYLMLKSSSLLQKNFERKIIKELYTEISDKFKKHSKNKGVTYIHSDKFRGIVSNSLPSFWTSSLSKSWDTK